MRKKINKKFSIFLKLTILIVLFIALVNISIGFVFSRFFEKGPPGFPDRFPELVNKYLLNNLGNPPDTVKAAILSKELEANIRIEMPFLKWASDESIPDIEHLSKDKDFRNTERNFVVRQRGRPYFINKSEAGYIIFTPVLPRDFMNETGLIIALIIIFTILATLLYFSLRWIFGPIKKLSEGVALISEGNFENNIDVNRKDELGNLAESINEMKENISNMLKSKESLLIDVSHELRSPLTRIKLANEFIENEKISSKIREDVNEMELMITELLEVYRTGKENSGMKKEKTDLADLVKRVIIKYGPGKIKFNSEVNEVYVFADRKKIESALSNIIDNALKYSDELPVIIKLYLENRNGNTVNISVKDKGRGIDEKEMEKIFEPFYRTDKSRNKKINGYGLGLSLVKKIIEDHKAGIEVHSKPDEGTEFIISIPVYFSEDS